MSAKTAQRIKLNVGREHRSVLIGPLKIRTQRRISMYLKYLQMLLVVLAVNLAIPAFSQVAPEAKGGGLPLTVGVGYSNYATDWNGRLSGPMIWVDWNFYRSPLVPARIWHRGGGSRPQLRPHRRRLESTPGHRRGRGNLYGAPLPQVPSLCEVPGGLWQHRL